MASAYEWWWCPECGEPIELCSSYGTCPNAEISKSNVEAAQQPRALDALPESECPYCHEKLTGTYGEHVLQKAERQ